MILLDTHVWIWWVSGSADLPRRLARLIERRIETEPVWVSSVSVWEVALLAAR